MPSFPLGAHFSVRSGFVAALREAERLNCSAFQMFSQNPRGWRTRTYTDDEFRAFRKERQRSAIERVVVHAPYLPNLCTSNEVLYDRSVDCLVGDLDRSERLGADYLVIHPGAYSPEKDAGIGIRRLADAVNKAISSVPGQTMILIENMAGGGRRLGGSLSELREMLGRIREEKRVGICFDTCHAYAAGLDFRTPASARRLLDEFDRDIGLERIRVFHMNDSKGEFSGRRDRHEHLGEGQIGLEGFSALFGAHDFSGRAFILETPKETAADDRRNLATLAGLLDPASPCARK